MSYSFPEGAKFLFSQTFAAAKTVTGITNADPAVATAVAHGYVDNDEILLNSGWEDAGDSVYKVDQLSTDTFSLLDLDTSDTAWFAAGAGVGSAQKISGWVEIPQVLTIATSGGDPKYTPIAPLARRNAFNVPTGFNPASVTLTMGFDGSNANYKTMKAISRKLTKVAFKLLLAGGETSYGYGYMAASEIPSLNSGQPNQVTATFSFIGRATSY